MGEGQGERGRATHNLPGLSRTHAHSTQLALNRTNSKCLLALPFSSYWEPWHGQLYLLVDFTHGTMQPRWVQTALMPKSW